MKKFYLALMGLFIAATLCGAEAKPTKSTYQEVSKPDSYIIPTQKIVGAEQPVALGELVDLTVSPIAQMPTNLVGISYTWRVYDNGKVKHIRESNGGVYFGTGMKPKTLLVECAVTYLFLKKDGDQITDVATRTVILSTTLTIGDAPAPGPNPGPSPAPGLPDGKYKLSQTAYNLANQKVTNATARVKGAPAIANSLRGIASAVSAGAVPSVEELIKKTKASQLTALQGVQVNPADWDAFGTSLQDTVYALYKGKQLDTTSDFATAWGEIATGLEAIKQ